MMGLKEVRHAQRQRYGSVNADPTLHIIGCPLTKTAGYVESFQLPIFGILAHWPCDSILYMYKSCVIINITVKYSDISAKAK